MHFNLNTRITRRNLEFHNLTLGEVFTLADDNDVPGIKTSTNEALCYDNAGQAWVISPMAPTLDIISYPDAELIFNTAAANPYG